MSDSSAGTSDSSGGGKRVVLVAAYADNRAIGNAGGIPWHIPEDFAHFKATTLGHILVMGRATYDSIGRPLPGRTTIVITRDPHWSAAGVLTAHSFEEALGLAADLPGDVMVAGGSQIYSLALPYATHQVLTEIHLSPTADAFYPEFDSSAWVEVDRKDRDDLSWVWLERSPATRRLA
jgi:dihydrofolate reductase